MVYCPVKEAGGSSGLFGHPVNLMVDDIAWIAARPIGEQVNDNEVEDEFERLREEMESETKVAVLPTRTASINVAAVDDGLSDFLSAFV
jgi:hypothetical protein